MQDDQATSPDGAGDGPAELRVHDPRTGRDYRLPIRDGAVRALDLRSIRTDPGDFGLLSYDPAFLNTASCRSAITFIDGENGVLRYRGYAIEDLAGEARFPEVAWLLWHGELPDAGQLAAFEADLAEAGAALPAPAAAVLDALDPGLHPMRALVAGLAVLGGCFPDAAEVLDAEARARHARRLLALTPLLAARAWRRRQGLPPVEPDAGLSYAGNLLRLLLGAPGEPYLPDPDVERALDALLILHADHEQNCSTNAMRSVGSSRVDPYSAAAAATAALFGPLHGGANQAVLHMLDEIGTVASIPAFLDACRRGERRLMGFGHRVYKNYDPRARIIGDLARQVFARTGDSPRLAVARELERQALSDPYFVERRLYPNVDFFSGLVYDALGFPPEMFPVFFALGRMAGWLAHWDEMHRDPEQRIARPRQIYTGPGPRPWVPLAARG